MDKMFVQVNVEDKEVKDNDGFIFCGHSDSCGSIEGICHPIFLIGGKNESK